MSRLEITRSKKSSVPTGSARAFGVVLLLAPLLVQAQVTFDQTRTSIFAYYGATDGVKNGLLKTETVEPGNVPLCVATTYVYDGYGNKTQATKANCAGATGNALFTSRASTNAFAAQTVSVAGVASVAIPAGTVATSSANALGQTETKTYDPRFGVALSLQGPNQLTTRWTVDDFGRVTAESRADGTRTFTYYCYIAGRVSDTSSNTPGCPSPGVAEIPAYAVAFVHTETHDNSAAPGLKNGPFGRVYSDRAGRKLRTVTEAFDGAAQPGGTSRLIVQDVDYNRVGAQTIATQPYFLDTGSSTSTGNSNTSPFGMSRTDYDVLGRPVQVYTSDVTAPGNQGGSRARVAFYSPPGTQASLVKIDYSGLNTTTTDDQGKTRVEEKNVDGKAVRVTDALGAQVAYQHDAFGNLLTTKDALQNQVAVGYDARGRKVSTTDPDAGVWAYCYDALGQLIAQQNSKMRGSNTPGACPAAPNNGGVTANAVASWVTMAYDKLGRVASRVEPEYATTWTYDTCTKGVGKLCEVNSSNGVNRKSVYDSLGRPVNSRTTIGGGLTIGPSFATAVAYDSVNGRPVSQTYPTGLQVSYNYTAKGFLSSLTLATAANVAPLPATAGGTPVTGTTLAAGSMLWRADAFNAWGRAEQQTYGNGVGGKAVFDPSTGRLTNLTAGVGTATNVLNQGYVWDSISHVVQRNDANGDGNTGAVSDTFGYDAIGRLASYSVKAPAVPNLGRTVILQYNALGMLLYKSDVGNYVYGAQATAGVRPHALQSVIGAAATTNYDGYDANGNLTSASAGKYRAVSYTSFNLPDGTAGLQGPAGGPKYTWQYDANHQRVKETEVTAASTRTTWSMHPDNQGGLAFESESSTLSPTPSNRHYLSAGGMSMGVLVTNGALPTLAAAQTAPLAPTGTLTIVKVEYWHKDHLGSLVATTDHQGNVTARYAYDPFGKRRATNGNYDAAGNLVVDWTTNTNAGTDRGFTGHEHLDDVGVIHMNGRIFDPTLGRFMQGDPLIQDPLNLQNYDRYGYCYNNPLTCTDPSGQSWLSDRWHAIWRNPYARVVIAVVVAYVSYGYGSGWAASALASTETAATAGYSAATINAVANLGGSVAAGFAGGAAASGTLNGGLQGAASAGLFFGAGELIGGAGGLFSSGAVSTPIEQVAIHGVVGCVASVIGGAKCGPGFISAALSKAAFAYGVVPQNPAAGFVAATVLGGAGSVIAGGKFANGAVTAAFGYLFNELLHQGNPRDAMRRSGYADGGRAVSSVKRDTCDEV
jgi:RHS repeat-associated protein